MTFSHVPIILVILIIMVLVPAGCLEESINSEKPTASSVPVTPIESTPTTHNSRFDYLIAAINGEKPTVSSVPLTPIESTPTKPSTLPTYGPLFGYWIKIDPISDKHVGEIFTVNSTTNLSVGGEIIVRIYKTDYHPSIYGDEPRWIVGTIKVTPGNNEINTSSFIINSSELYPFPAKYYFTESAMFEEVTGIEQFNIS